uniref:Uncharacterized protein n=1 Tax=Rhizophora mucronata TaxID=61149 RepID=A0A2P2NW07_RHIMU
MCGPADRRQLRGALSQTIGSDVQ